MLCAQRFVITRPNPPSPLYPLYTTYDQLRHLRCLRRLQRLLPARGGGTLSGTRPGFHSRCACVVRLCCAWCAWCCAWGSLRSSVALRYTFPVHPLPIFLRPAVHSILALRQPYAFILGATRGSVRAPSMHLPRYTHTHAHPIITIRPALYTSDTLPAAPSCYINI